MLKWINNELVEIKYDKLDYWVMYLDGDLPLEELLKFVKLLSLKKTGSPPQELPFILLFI